MDELKEKILNEMMISTEEHERRKRMPVVHYPLCLWNRTPRPSKYEAKKLRLILDAVKAGRKSEISGFDDVPDFNLLTFSMLLRKMARSQNILIHVKWKFEPEYQLKYIVVTG